MLCCSDCTRARKCMRAVCNNEDDATQPVENWLNYGSCSIQWKDGKVVKEENYVCGPQGNWSMFKPLKKENKEMNDNLKVCIELIPYTKDINLDFDNPVRVRSVWNHDELVEIEHQGHKFIVSESELTKAVSRASHFRW